MKSNDFIELKTIQNKIGQRFVEKFKKLFGDKTTFDEFITLTLISMEQEKNYSYFIMFANVWYEYEPKIISNFYKNEVIHKPIQKLIASIAGTKERVDQISLHIALENMVLNGFLDSAFGSKLIEFSMEYIPLFKKDFEGFLKDFNSPTPLLIDDHERPNVYD